MAMVIENFETDRYSKEQIIAILKLYVEQTDWLYLTREEAMKNGWTYEDAQI